MNTISIICACKNRNEALKISIQSWLINNKINEIIVVDWSSDEPLEELAKIDKRIKIIRVNNQKYFNQPQPLNLALNLACGDKILKLDADHIMNPYYNFLDLYEIDSQSFVCGDTDEDEKTVAWNEYFKPMRGLLYCNKNSLKDIGGYNEEKINHYGYEDSEIEDRLIRNGFKKIKLKFDHTFFHIPHSIKKRYENFKDGSSFLETMRNIFEETKHYRTQEEHDWLIDYQVVHNNIMENKNYYSVNNYLKIENKTVWEINKIDEQYFEAHIIGGN
jgi:glycosyltransferase involved in cell wall biosynthesis